MTTLRTKSARQKFVSLTRQKKSSPVAWLSVKSLFHGVPPDQMLVICLFGLIVFGWVMVYSASALFAESHYHDQYFFLKRQIIWSLAGVVAFVMAANLPFQFLQRSTYVLYGVTLALLVLVLAIGPRISGAQRWLRFGPLNFQPSELAKLSIIILVADYMDRRQSRLKSFKRGLIPLLGLVAVPVALILKEPDLGTPMLIAVVVVSLLFLGGANWRHLMTMALGSLPLLGMAVFMVRYRLLRLFAYLNPWKDPQGTSYQLVQSLLAMGSGGFWGRGLGESRIKVAHLPDAHTDFIFSVLGEELGLIGTLACVALFFFLCARGLYLARRAPNCFSMLVASGLSLTIGFQALINMGVASGLFPTKGMPLPFISFGGSSLVIMMAMVGLLANVSRQTKELSSRPGR